MRILGLYDFLNTFHNLEFMKRSLKEIEGIIETSFPNSVPTGCWGHGQGGVPHRTGDS